MIVPFIDEVIRQHAEEAAFGWALRDRALDSPAWPLTELMRIDARSLAHVDALVLAGEHAWPIMIGAWADGWPGECFAALLTAARLSRWDRIDEALALITNPEAEHAAGAALGWLAEDVALTMIRWWLEGDDPLRQRLAVRGLIEQRADPGPKIQRWLASDDPELEIAALDLLAALGRVEPAGPHAAALEHDDPRVRLAGMQGLWRLGDPQIAERMLEHVTSEPIDRPRADLGCALGLIALPKSAAERWLARLVGLPTPRLALVGAAAIGDPTLVPWLIEQTANPELAQTAAYALVAITGVDLELERLDGDPPSPPETDGPEDDMPWPDPLALARWWSSAASDPVVGPGALWGRRGRSGLRSVLDDRDAPQRLRTLAAWRLAFMTPGVRFPSDAPAYRQRAWLEIP